MINSRQYMPFNFYRQVNDYMDKDYGPDEEFQSLHGQCFEISDRE